MTDITAIHLNGKIRIANHEPLMDIDKKSAEILLETLTSALKECPNDPENILTEFFNMYKLDDLEGCNIARQVISELKADGYEILYVQNRKGKK